MVVEAPRTLHPLLRRLPGITALTGPDEPPPPHDLPDLRAAAEREEVERILREGGFPLASVLCERTPEQALAHAAEWTVNRDGVAR